jgi:hypothetical protein
MGERERGIERRGFVSSIPLVKSLLLFPNPTDDAALGSRGNEGRKDWICVSAELGEGRMEERTESMKMTKKPSANQEGENGRNGHWIFGAAQHMPHMGGR